MACAQGELAFNPFLRCGEPDLAAWCGLPGGDPVAVLAALRARKDSFGLAAALTTRALSLAALCEPAMRWLGLRR